MVDGYKKVIADDGNITGNLFHTFKYVLVMLVIENKFLFPHSKYIPKIILF